MFFSSKKWLKDWHIICDDRWNTEKLFELYADEISRMQHAGKELFLCGAIRALAGTEAPEEYQNGTSGNFAIRKKDDTKFLVTAQGAHKGNLQTNDFVVVHEVDWWNRNIYITSLDDFAHLPSTDAPLIAVAFVSSKTVLVWAHFHEVIDAPREIRITYPALNAVEWDQLKRLVRFGIREMNMVDHDLYRKGKKNNSVDSAIVLGEHPEETFLRARTLMERARSFKKAV